MAEYKPTQAQLDAMYTRGRPVLVSAGAGSGKTTVLTERLMSYICDEKDPKDVDSFLVITFTRAAAAELRGRIGEKLAARLASDPGNRRLRRQSALCQRAKIGTIHSFCADVLRENCQAAGLSPDFRIIDDERAAAMRAAALERVLESRYEELDSRDDFRLLADTVGSGRDDRKLAELVLNLHSRMQCHARPDVWAKEQAAALHGSGGDAGETPWGQELLQWAKGLTVFWSGEFDRLIQKAAEYEPLKKAYANSLSESAEQMRALGRALDTGWDAAGTCLPVVFPRMVTPKNNPAPELSEHIKARREACKGDMKKLTETFQMPSDELLSDLAATAPAMEALLELTLDFDRAYSKDKRRGNMMDFSDLEHMTAQLLIDENGEYTALASQLSGRFTEVMVDEFQDVSLVQDAIFTAVSDRGRKLFMVGDVKQSIYRFRLADPGIFKRKYNSCSEEDKSAPKLILLRENYRSRREVLDGANSIFSLCMTDELGDVDYDEASMLIYGAKYAYGEEQAPKPELMLLDYSGSSDDDSPDKTAAEAAFVADRIRELVESGAEVAVPGGKRPMEYGDVAILLRSANTVGGVYRRALAEAGVPAGAVQGSGFFTSLEVSTVISMLAVMDNPHKDIPLIAVLRSAALGFTPDELSEIRMADRDADFYTALEKAAKDNEKCSDFLGRLASLRALAADMSASEITWQVMEELDMLAVCSAMDDGRQRRANLMELMELSESFESTGYRGLHRYVLWLQNLAAKGESPSAGTGSASAVKIMSIHKSKGLEFPVVFLCDTGRRFNTQDQRETVLVHPELGLGPKRVDTERRIQYPTLARTAITRRLDREMRSEEMRLLYVALTRAKERLYITAALKNAGKALEKAEASVSVPMAPETLSQARSMAGWLMYACIADDGRNISCTVCGDSRSEEKTVTESPERAAADEAALAELQRRLSFAYPYSSAAELPSKITATELKGRENADTDAESLVKPSAFSFRMPDLDGGERKLTAAERGVATHLVLQYMDFEKGRSRKGISEETERLREEKFISKREAEAVNVSAIERLFRSELGQRMLKAEKPLREFRFSLLLDADKLYPDAAGEELLLQGVVDCCIEEDGGLVIIDYKTDNVRTDDEITARAELYRGQLMAYAEALGRIFEKPVHECVLYFLTPGREVKVYKK